ncbi:hypothetical protein ACP4OV_029446 [Aristida adscensionis]
MTAVKLLDSCMRDSSLYTYACCSFEAERQLWEMKLLSRELYDIIILYRSAHLWRIIKSNHLAQYSWPKYVFLHCSFNVGTKVDYFDLQV